MAIRFHFQKKVSLKQRRIVKDFILLIFSREKKELANLDFVFCDNAYLLNINRTFLNHDYFTDIITFEMSDQSASGIEGEIYISVEMISENASRFKEKVEEELKRVMFHGVLHLCGYDDKTAHEKATMRKKENYYLAMFHGEH